MADDTRFPLGPAAEYRRAPLPVWNQTAEDARRTPGERIADDMTNVIGSWPFIIAQTVLMLVWIGINAYLAYAYATRHSAVGAWDPYPFILLNLALSFQSAYAGSIVLMSQNRQSQRDRRRAEQDYLVNQRAEQEIDLVLRQLVYNNHLHREALQRLEALERRVAALAERLDD